ncbi:hypothetical protein [Bradyrhizobium sp.]|uniref:hypothetical protein n=1 Tax=Bradyrhizobium sp. TaxID=376 RepID=UPI003C697577
MSQAMALGALKQNDNREKRRSPKFDETSKTDLKQCADKYLGTPFRKRGNPLYLAITLLLRKRANRARLLMSRRFREDADNPFWSNHVAASYRSALDTGTLLPETRSLGRQV